MAPEKSQKEAGRILRNTYIEETAEKAVGYKIG